MKLAESSIQDQPQAQFSSIALKGPDDIVTHTVAFTLLEKVREADPAYIFMIKIMTKLLQLNPEKKENNEVNKHVSNFELFWS
jgi:hypothetical protein